MVRLTTTASSLGILTTTVSLTVRYNSVTSTNGWNYAGQYPPDGWVDNYNLEQTQPIGRITKLVPSSIDNRWRVQKPSNMPTERSERDLPMPPLSLRVPLPFCFGQSVSDPCLNITERFCTGMRDLHALIRKDRLSVQAKYLLWIFVNYVSKFGVLFFPRSKIDTFSALLFPVFGCFVKTACNVGETSESTSHKY